jgi:hypothetical protein
MKLTFILIFFRYTKTVVAAPVNPQKYNPELTWTQRSPDPRIAQLSDKLRHIRQVGLSSYISLSLYLCISICDITSSCMGHKITLVEKLVKTFLKAR